MLSCQLWLSEVIQILKRRFVKLSCVKVFTKLNNKNSTYYFYSKFTMKNVFLVCVSSFSNRKGLQIVLRSSLIFKTRGFEKQCLIPIRIRKYPIKSSVNVSALQIEQIIVTYCFFIMPNYFSFVVQKKEKPDLTFYDPFKYCKHCSLQCGWEKQYNSIRDSFNQYIDLLDEKKLRCKISM